MRPWQATELSVSYSPSLDIGGGVVPSALASNKRAEFTSGFSPSEARLALLRSVGLGEAVARVRHRERAILLRGELDPIGFAVVDRCRLKARRRRCRRLDRLNGQGRPVGIHQIGDEHAGL